MKDYPLNYSPRLTNIRDFIEFTETTYTTDLAFSYRIKPRDEEIQKVSFIDLANNTRALAAAIIEKGLCGKRVAVIGKLTYGWVNTYLSLLYAGIVAVPLDPDWSNEDLIEAMKKAECSALFASKETVNNKAAQLIEAMGFEYTVAMDDVDDNGICGIKLSELRAEGEGVLAEKENIFEEHPIDDDALALLVFTSGTTGKGKGVMLSQSAIFLDITSGMELVSVSKKTIGALPPHHTFGSTVGIIGNLLVGSEIYITSGIKYISKEIKEQKPGHLILVPLYIEAFYRRIMTNAKESGRDKKLFRAMKISNTLTKVGVDLRRRFFKTVLDAFGGELHTIISGGAPMNQEIIDTFRSLGVTILNGYGITECAPLIAVNRNKYYRDGSIGRVVPIADVKINEPDENGEGEIFIKGPNVMMGYFKDDEATAAAFDEDGYFKTGDYGRFDGDGFLYITGRLKNLIILSNGKNVYPEEIEQELARIPGVADVVVYEGISRRGNDHNAIVAEIFADEEFIKQNEIADKYEYFKPFINEFNRTCVPYKKIGLLKIRDVDFDKNTLRKITRFTIDKTID